MPDRPIPGVLRQLRRTFGHAESNASDGQLLERFLAQRDEDAFELLVWRHERLVLSACRRILQDAHDAEDAFQATFLTLVRKAGSIGRGQALASWLYQVACRIALRARASVARRTGHEQQCLDLSGIAAKADDAAVERRELGPLLDEEISRLPEKYRAPVVLCYLEGQTYDQAARRLGCPVGTISTRLAHARARLRGRLARRGVELGALAAVLCECAVAAVPGALVSATVKAAAGPAVTGVVSPQVVAMTEGALRAMRMTKFRIAAALLLAMGLLGGGVTLLTPGAPSAQAAGEKKGPAVNGKAAPKTDRERLQGTWVAVSINIRNQEAPEEELLATRILFTGDRMTWRRASGNDVAAPFAIDPTQKLKTIDWKGKGVGIYEFVGDRLRLCLTDDEAQRSREEERPAEFKPGQRRIVFVLKRLKGSGPVPARKPPPDARTETKTDKDRLQGDWQAVSINAEGQDQASGEEARLLGIKFQGNQVTMSAPLGDTELAYRLDTKKNPKAIDIEGDRPGVGIYRFAGDRLHLCLVEKDHPRPTDFKPGPKRMVMVLERAADRAALRLQVKTLREMWRELRDSNAALKEELKRRDGLGMRKHEVAGILKEVNVEKNIVSLTLGRTKLTVNDIPLSARSKVFLGLKACTINDLKPGMEITLRLETNGDRTEITCIEASPGRKE